MREVLDGLARGRGPMHFEDRCICSDGSVVWLDWNVVADQGLLYAAGRDVTERRREQARLREAKRMVEASRDELSVLAEQQAALRRLRRWSARAVPPSRCSQRWLELARCLGVHHSALVRYEPNGTAIVLAARDEPGSKKMRVGKRFSFQGESVAAMILRTGRPARMDSHDAVAGPDAKYISDMGLHSGVGTPIVVDGRLWGAAVVGSLRLEPLPQTQRCGSGTSQTSSRPRSPTPRRAQSSPHLGRGLSRPPIVPGADSNATCTTVLSGGSSRWGWSYAQPRFRCRPN